MRFLILQLNTINKFVSEYQDTWQQYFHRIALQYGL